VREGIQKTLLRFQLLTIPSLDHKAEIVWISGLPLLFAAKKPHQGRIGGPERKAVNPKTKKPDTLAWLSDV
jgi:hypothetical protein